MSSFSFRGNASGTQSQSEPHDVVLMSPTSMTDDDTATLDSLNWNDVVDRFSFVLVDISFGNDHYDKWIKAEDIASGQDYYTSAGAGNTTAIFNFNMSTGGFEFFSSSGSTATVTIYGFLKQNTIISPTDAAINDQSSSGYFDVGNMRQQWGVVAGGSTNGDLVFPAPFANTNYSWVGTVEKGSLNQMFGVQYSSKTTTQVHWDKVFHGSGGGDTITGATGEPFNWIAIGPKP